MRLFTALAAALAIASPAFAGQIVSLKAETRSSGATVTLGDLFDGAGAAGRTVVATRSGSSVVLDAGTVQLAARRVGLDWANTEGLHKIIVEGAAGQVFVAAPSAHGNVEVLTYTRSLNVGEIVQPADLAWVKVAGAPSDSPNDTDMVIGQAAKRPLRAGAIVTAHDVGAAQVIKAGDLVTVTYDADAVTLSLQGKAMGTAGVGDLLAVQNTASKKLVQAIVTGPGAAVVGPAADQMKSARSLRYAGR